MRGCRPGHAALVWKPCHALLGGTSATGCVMSSLAEAPQNQHCLAEVHWQRDKSKGVDTSGAAVLNA